MIEDHHIRSRTRERENRDDSWWIEQSDICLQLAIPNHERISCSNVNGSELDNHTESTSFNRNYIYRNLNGKREIKGYSGRG